MTTKTRSEIVQADVTALLRARNPLIWIVTREEARVERYLVAAAATAKFATRTWDVMAGCREAPNGKNVAVGGPDPDSMLGAIEELAKKEGGSTRTMWIMRDLPPWLGGPGGARTLRHLRNVVHTLPRTVPDSAQALVILAPTGDVPPELSAQATVIEWPLPDREEVESILEASLTVLKEDDRPKALPRNLRAAAIDAAVGLTGEEAMSCYARSLVQCQRIDPVLVAHEKKRVITRERVLEWYDPLPGGLEAVGGLENLKKWLMLRSTAYSVTARTYGLQTPKGVFLVGVPGCGKSYIAKAIATAWGCPLLKLDLNALKSKFVGESEGNLRRALKVIEAIGRCVLWIDEIEKSLQGATSGSSDGGVSSDALGTILTWMQERQGEAFVIATANDVEALPPELLRKGRFDEIFFVDLPTRKERREILLAALRLFNRDAKKLKIDQTLVAQATDQFTGSEIAQLVPEAMFAAFADGERELGTDDLVEAAKATVRLSKTADVKIKKLREWAEERARPASAPEVTSSALRESGRAIDVN